MDMHWSGTPGRVATPGRWLAGLCAALLALTGALATAQEAVVADPPGRVGRLADVQGTVWAFDERDGSWHGAERNLPVTTGDRFTTEQGARAEVRVGSTVLRIGSGSELEFVRLDDDRLVVRLHRGGLALRVLAREIAEEIEIVTAEGRLVPLRAGHYRIDREDDNSFAGVWSGELLFQGENNVRQIGQGERIEFWFDRKSQTARTRGSSLPDDRLSAWAVQADQQAQRTAAHRYVSPEMTGAEALEQHGRWDRHPELGAVWAPTSVAEDWAPYQQGRWAWVRPWGWTWVDAAPWGFAPFHYGRWMSWQGRWVWWPGAYQPRPVYAPALVAWAGGPSVGVSISIGGRGPGVRWAPLAPREIYVPAYRVTPIYVERINPGHRHDGNDRNDRHDRSDRHDDRRDKPGHRDHPRQVPTGPIMYSNQGVPAGVTAVPSNVMSTRPPTTQAPAAPVLRETPVVGTPNRRDLRPQAPAAAAEPRQPRRAEPAAKADEPDRPERPERAQRVNEREEKRTPESRQDQRRRERNQ